MQYNRHLTTKAQRDVLIGKKWPVRKIDVSQVIHNDCLVWDEDAKDYYFQDFSLMMQILDTIEDGTFVPTNIPLEWEKKGDEIYRRIERLPALYQDIKKNGVKEPIMVEDTGERIDGSFRSMISYYLGYKTIPASTARFEYTDIDEDYIIRRISTNAQFRKPDYYKFRYPNGMWNVRTDNNVYQENALERWNVLQKYIGKGQNIFDLGCNEGYMSVMSAMMGNRVIGVDHEHGTNAWLNKLIFEFYTKNKLDITFYEIDISGVIEYMDNPNFDVCLALNVLYHLPRKVQTELMLRVPAKRMIIQCNHRKEKERAKYYTSHVDDARKLAEDTGWTIEKQIDWRDKPILIIKK